MNIFWIVLVLAVLTGIVACALIGIWFFRPHDAFTVDYRGIPPEEVTFSGHVQPEERRKGIYCSHPVTDLPLIRLQGSAWKDALALFA